MAYFHEKTAVPNFLSLRWSVAEVVGDQLEPALALVCVMVNFMCQLGWTKGCTDSCKTFLRVSVRAFQKRLAFELVD